jgi:hypothetical protein
VAQLDDEVGVLRFVNARPDRLRDRHEQGGD